MTGSARVVTLLHVASGQVRDKTLSALFVANALSERPARHGSRKGA